MDDPGGDLTARVVRVVLKELKPGGPTMAKDPNLRRDDYGTHGSLASAKGEESPAKGEEGEESPAKGEEGEESPAKGEGGLAKSALQRLTPAEAADAIRDDIESNPATITDPAMQHRMRFVTEVCHYLGLEPTPVNVQRVVDALHDAGIEDGAPEEYPKWVTYERDGAWYGVAVENADEEAKVNAGDWDQVKNPSQPVAAPRPKGSSKPAVEEEHI